jgi:hypothetical protein
VVGSWELNLVIPRDDWHGWDAGVAFAPDGRLLATTRTLDRIQLFDLDARKEVGTLSAADAPFIESLCFRPDGGQLAVAGQDHTVRLWNLHALRGHLHALGLDWEPLAEPPRPLPDAVTQMRVFPDTVEAECLPVTASGGGTYKVQDMTLWDREKWSGGKQLFCQADDGGFVELQVEAPQFGAYKLVVSLTRAPDYGRVEVTLDGQRIGPAFDGFAEAVTPPTRVPLGRIELTRGSHRLRFTATGKNMGATGCFMGIDCLELRPVLTEPQNP